MDDIKEPRTRLIWVFLVIAWVVFGFSTYWEWQEERDSQRLHKALIERNGIK